MEDFLVFQKGSKWGESFYKFLIKKYQELKNTLENGGEIDIQEFTVLKELIDLTAFSLTIKYYDKYGFAIS